MKLDEYVNTLDNLEDNISSNLPKARATIIVPSTKACLHVSPSPESFVLSKQLEGRRRWKTGEEGGLTFEPTRKNLDHIREVYDLTIHDPFIDFEEMHDEIHALKERVVYTPKTIPYKFQEQATDLIRQAPNKGKNFALFCEPGTGKSKMAIDRTCELFVNQRIRSCIVIAPKGVHQQWSEEQIPTHCGTRYYCYTWGGSIKKLRFRKKKKTTLVFLCINYDALRTKKGWETVQNFIKVYHGLFGIIFDESHLIKNPSSQRWKRCFELARDDDCYSRLLLTGTPIAKNLCDEWAQFKILNEGIIGIRYLSHFKNKYCKFGGKNGQQIVGSRNLEEFKALTGPYIFRARKTELEGMPEKVYERWRFDLNDDLKVLYRKMALDLIIQIEEAKKAGQRESIIAQNAAVKVLRLQQISNGFSRNERKETKWLVEDVENSRLRALIDCLDNHVPPDEKVIIWCRFRDDILLLSQYIPNMVTYYGGLSEKERKINLNLWMDKTSNVRCLIATPAAGGTGLNLQKSGCKYAIYYSNSENSIHRWQSEDRIHRIGADATQPVIYIDLVAKATRDIDILANLRMKKSISDLALGDIVDSIKGVLK